MDKKGTKMFLSLLRGVVIPETHPVALAEISSSYYRGLTFSSSLKLVLQVEGPNTFLITQEMFGESLLKAFD